LRRMSRDIARTYHRQYAEALVDDESARTVGAFGVLVRGAEQRLNAAVGVKKVSNAGC
jgi:hypothetical protein